MRFKKLKYDVQPSQAAAWSLTIISACRAVACRPQGDCAMNDSSHSTANADVDQNRRVVRTRLHGVELLFNSRLNKGTA